MKTTFASAVAFAILFGGAISSPEAQNAQVFGDFQAEPALLRRQVTKSQDDGKSPDETYEIKWYKKKDCKGSVTTDMTKGKIIYGAQYDMSDVVSIHTNRDLMNNEQLDFSTVAHKKLVRASNDSILEERGVPKDCSQFVVSAPVAPIALEKGCYNIPKLPVDCFRLWKLPY